MPGQPSIDALQAASPLPTGGPVERPWTIKWAVTGMAVGALVAAASIWVAYLETVAINRATYQSFGGEGFGGNEAVMDSVLHAGIWLAIGIAAAIALVEITLWVTLAITNWRGYGPARIVATALGALDILLTAGTVWISIAGDHTVAISLGYNIADAVLVVAILVLLWLPASATYYPAKRLERAIRVVNAARAANIQAT